VAISIEGDNVKVRFHRIQRAGRRIVNANLRYRRLSYRLRVSLSAGGRCSLHSRVVAADPVIAPEGTVVNALPPAAMAGGQCGDFSADHRRVVGRACASRARAYSGGVPPGTMNNLTLGDTTPVPRKFRVLRRLSPEGWARRRASPGESAVHTHMTNSWNTPIEALENQYPLRVRRYQIPARLRRQRAKRGWRWRDSAKLNS